MSDDQQTAEVAATVERVLADDGWDSIDLTALKGAMLEAVAWSLLDQTSDVADRGASKESYAAALASAGKVAEALAGRVPQVDDREALAEAGCRHLHSTRWQYAATSSPCDECLTFTAGALAAGFRRHPEGTTVTEWRLRCNHGVSGEHEHRWHLPDPGPSCTDAVVERHERTSYDDVVSEWVAVDE